MKKVPANRRYWAQRKAAKRRAKIVEGICWGALIVVGGATFLVGMAAFGTTL